jgi:uncharacterized membrane protein
MAIKYKKILVMTLVAIAMLSGVTNLVLFKYLEGVSPQTPNIISGTIYLQNDHGYYFYVDYMYYLIQKILWGVFALFAVVAAFLENKWNTIHNSFNDLPKKLY